DPIRTVGSQIGEPLRIHYGLSRREAREHAVRLATRVALPEPAQVVRRYPHQLSGGQRQRVAIAMALAAGPGLLIADEPTTALDVTVQRGIIELFDGLVQASGLSLVFVTHDIAMLAQMGGRALVMADGRIVENADVAQLVHAPEHPVTRHLAAAALATGWSPAVHA
ncbi:MAG: ABC transporter ATP-binding protein, partial [Cellulomonadaceae bacterium]|nr:ABC transporter ATP-binding protein [Cellulomonadaceae bacterium]